MVLKKEAQASFLDVDGSYLLIGVLQETAESFINYHILQRLKESFIKIRGLLNIFDFRRVNKWQ